MKNNEKIDQILKHALSPEDEPDYWLNQKIKNRIKERENMAKLNGKKLRKRIPAVVLSSVLVLSVGSVTAVAAWKYLTPDQVAEEVSSKYLSEAFKSKDAIEINETQEFGQYRVTLMGVVSGVNLNEYLEKDQIENDKTYMVVAIENADGMPRPGMDDKAYGETPFFVSPLVKGLNPGEFNAVTMDGGYSEIVKDGIQYRIAECDNVEMFADRGLYVCVSSSSYYDREAFQYDEKTGEISRNEKYEGVNALFSLPIDPGKADSEAAEAYISQMKDGTRNQETKEDAEAAEKAEAEVDAMGKWDQDRLDKEADLLKDTVQTLKADDKGMLNYSYTIGNDGQSGSGSVLESAIFKDGQYGLSETMQFVGGDNGFEFVETFSRNEDGTIIFAVYKIK